jgi:hypothetical protein
MSQRLHAVVLGLLAVLLVPTTGFPQSGSPEAATGQIAPMNPRVESARLGVAPVEVAAEDPASALQRQRRGMGEPIALMVVGGGALLAGLIIGGDAGTVIAVGGAIIGLYGLYQYLR